MHKLYFSIFFVLGLLTNILFVGFTILFVSKGFSTYQISILTSISFLGAIFQLFLGRIFDRSKNKNRTLQIVLAILFFLTLAMLFFESFINYLFLIFTISIFRMPILGLFEEMSLSYCIEYNLDFPTLRSGASWGYASSLLFVLPFVFFDSSNGIILIALLSFIICIFLLHFTTSASIPNSKEHHSFINSIKLIFTKKISLLILSSAIIMGVTQLKLAYQNILLEDLNAPFYIIALANFFTVSFELYLMSRYNKFFKSHSVKKAFTLSAFIVFTQLILFSFSNSILFTLSITLFHGIAMSIFIPTLGLALRKNLSLSLTSTGFLLNIIVTSLTSTAIGFLIITPIVSTFGISFAFIALAMVSLLSLIPTHLNDLDK